MSGADSRGFDWKEIAGVLHIAGVSSRVTFWRAVQRLSTENVDRERPTIVQKEGADSHNVKPEKLPSKRGEKLLSTGLLSLPRRRDKRRGKL
jgi:hypothetical protein